MLRLLVLASLVAVSIANFTCGIAPRGPCFEGMCPSGFRCLEEEDVCCDEKQIVRIGCEDDADCSDVDCDHVDEIEFARQSCRKTCNFCNRTIEKPDSACRDLLDDCQDKIKFCRDIGYMPLVTLFCPHTCALCTEPVPAGPCLDQLQDCSNRTDFCTRASLSEYQKTVGCGAFCKRC